MASVSISGGGGINLNKPPHLSSQNSCLLSFPTTTSLTFQRKQPPNQNFSLRAHYNSNDGSSRGGGDFIAGFLLGGALCGALAYIYAPQIRRSVRNEDEHGFRRPKRPVYQDDGLENARQTLNAKISQLNSAIDNVASRLKGDNNMPLVSAETDPPPEEATF